MKTLYMTFAAALLLAGTAHAEKDKARHEKPKAESASSGTSTVPGAAGIDLEQAFKHADIDGDGAVSKAEAAGNERLVVGFDRADKNKDGKLSRDEFDSVYRPRGKRSK